MCGRYALPIEPQDLPAEFGKQNLAVDKVIDADKSTHHRYNIGPTQIAPAYYIYTDNKKDKLQAKHILRYMRWGMIPKWIKSKDKMSNYPTFNARYEKIGENKLWRTSVNQRCVIPIRGYYEWVKQTKPSKTTKQPYFIKRKDNKLMFLAGLYSRSILDGDEVYSYTIITRNAPKCLEWLHDRMPVVLDPDSEDFSRWLDTGEKKKWNDVKDLLKIYDGKNETLEWYKVDRSVGNVKNEDAKFVEPLVGIGEFFKVKQGPPEVKQEPLKVKQEPLKVKQEPLKVKQEPLKVKQEPLKVKQKPLEAEQKPLEAEQKPLEAAQEPLEQPLKKRKLRKKSL
ncbi:hypothetical protein FOA43_002026 [Brettanomyces nanus]|uniref:Abasic site processing protein n=1 Tax=Eeniella nana TaxID=13502 RepID=A0A875S198_EENNA|nr:uncharacterized protein FOA43_002026 [Brettanomyces nanus]QPG74693.1 hypothetical protein FOA43_002026 [Brettanomyces nanus]